MNNNQSGEKNHMFGKHFSKEAKEKSRLSHLAEKNPFWKGGTSPAYFRRLARENIIQKCSICLSIKRLEVHHIDQDRKNNSLKNLVILCKSCHSKIHKRDKNINGVKL